MPDRLNLYKDSNGEWRWSVVTANGEILAASSEGFTRKWSAKRNYKRTVRGA